MTPSTPVIIVAYLAVVLVCIVFLALIYLVISTKLFQPQHRQRMERQQQSGGSDTEWRLEAHQPERGENADIVDTLGRQADAAGDRDADGFKVVRFNENVEIIP